MNNRERIGELETEIHKLRKLSAVEDDAELRLLYAGLINKMVARIQDLKREKE